MSATAIVSGGISFLEKNFSGEAAGNGVEGTTNAARWGVAVEPVFMFTREVFWRGGEDGDM